MAKKLPKVLRCKHLPNETAAVKARRMFAVYEHFDALEYDENGEIDWSASNNILAPKLATEYLRGFQESKQRGASTKERRSLVEDVKRIRAEKNGCSVRHVCNSLQARGLYKDVDDLRRTYYRELEKIKSRRF